MATKKPAPKPVEKNLKPRAVPFQTPQPAPLDLVRNPNFDAAMAQQNYANSMRDQQARLAAERSGFSDRLRADDGQAFPREFSRPSLEPMINPEVIQKARTEYLASQPNNRRYADMMTKTKYGGEFGSSVGRGFDKWFEQNYINNPNSALSEQERMTLRNPNLKLAPQGPQEGGGNQDIIDFRKRIYDDLMARQGQPFPPDGGMGGARNFDIDYIEGGQRNAPMTPTPSQIAQFRNAQQGAMAGMQNNGSIYDSLRDYQARTYPVPMNQNTAVTGQQFGQIAQGIGRLMPIPQAQQMPVPDQQQGARADQYQNFLQQGLANYAAQNYPQQQQGAMGAQAAQNYAGGPMPSPAIPSPQLGGASAQPRGVPRPRQPKGFRSPIGRSAF